MGTNRGKRTDGIYVAGGVMCSNKTYIALGKWGGLVNCYPHEMSSIQTQSTKDGEKPG